jgi:hypothetical protein
MFQLAEGIESVDLSGINLVQPFTRMTPSGFKIIRCC